jgi:hypothetical protein
MSLTLLKREALKLPKAQRLKLASVLLDSVPAERAVPSYDEIERRADEALSGKVKIVSAVESKARIDRLMSKIKRDRQAREVQ